MPIFTVMANRLLLTLLALLTGLAAQIAPAQARACGQEAAAVAVTSLEAPRTCAVSALLAGLPEVGWRHTKRFTNDRFVSLKSVWMAPSVRIQVDRAHE